MKVVEPSWLSGRSWNPAVSGAGAAAATAAAVASLVRVSSLSASSVKVTRTWTVCPCSLDVSVYRWSRWPRRCPIPPAIH